MGIRRLDMGCALREHVIKVALWARIWIENVYYLSLGRLGPYLLACNT